MGPSVGDLFFASQDELEEVIASYRGSNVSFHCEDPAILRESTGRADARAAAARDRGNHSDGVCAVSDRKL